MTDAIQAQRDLAGLLQQQEELSKPITVQRQATRDAALKTVKELCAAHEFTASDLKGSIKVSRDTRTKTVTKAAYDFFAP